MNGISRDKQKLLDALESEDIGRINQALVLNEVLEIVSDLEVGNILIPMVVYQLQEAGGVHWAPEGLGWRLLTSIPSHPLWAHIDWLDVDELGLTFFPKEIEFLTNLRVISAYRNNLTSLPKEIGNLKNLEQLYLSNNQLTSLPREIGNLTTLRDIDLQENELEELPREFRKLVNLEEMGLDWGVSEKHVPSRVMIYYPYIE
jgi:hypothetical protein